MSGITDLAQLLQSMSPKLSDKEYVFCSVGGAPADYVALNPLAMFVETEGLTLVLESSSAHAANLAFDGLYRQITLRVHSSLEAVGLTAAVAAKLAADGISANVIAAYYHDHIFVPSGKAELALSALQQLTN